MNILPSKVPIFLIAVTQAMSRSHVARACGADSAWKYTQFKFR
jgi:hypothetical protein